MSNFDSVDAINRLMVERRLKRSDIFPSKARASDCLNRKRPLSIYMIRKLHFEYGIPAEILISPYKKTEENMGVDT